MAAERITHKPHLEVLPNHVGSHYDGSRALKVKTGMTKEKAIETLNKKPKMNDFDKNVMVSDFIAPRPWTYALRRLEKFDYVELWYFSQEGCADATQNERSENEDTLCLTNVDGMVSLMPILALRASKNAVQDIDLTWRQMEIAKTSFLQHIAKFHWPEKTVLSFTQFFMTLGAHPYRCRPCGEQALLIYQARVRCEWHNRLKEDQGFNIAIINEALLQGIYHEIMDKK